MALPTAATASLGRRAADALAGARDGGMCEGGADDDRRRLVRQARGQDLETHQRGDQRQQQRDVQDTHGLCVMRAGGGPILPRTRAHP